MMNKKRPITRTITTFWPQILPENAFVGVRWKEMIGMGGKQCLYIYICPIPMVTFEIQYRRNYND